MGTKENSMTMLLSGWADEEITFQKRTFSTEKASMCRSIISSRSTSLVVIEMIFHLRLLESSSMFASPLYWSPRYSPMILNIQILNEKKSFRVTTSKDLRLKPALSDSILLLFNFSFG